MLPAGLSGMHEFLYTNYASGEIHLNLALKTTMDC